MPRVSEEHLERRKQQILDAAQVCFARKGFAVTSMQDIFAESGLSAGAVYRYFKSKNEIIAALAFEAMAGLRSLMGELVHSDPLPTPAEVVATLAERIVDQSDPVGRIRLAPQVWALAVVDEETAVFVREAVHTMRGRWEEYAERMRAQGWLPADADTPAVAAALISLLPGFILQHLIVGDLTPEMLARGVRALMPYGEPVRPNEAP
ncbi:TetR/AcrR family transcriptional regulator [Nocardia sp. NPDC051832]|uniref:TetR/AcrR family transcriptional regulator n=1 Tax=Nocardia sp. NPDC051832 TaxID=3155673 RepID=UPI0034250151